MKSVQKLLCMAVVCTAVLCTASCKRGETNLLREVTAPESSRISVTDADVSKTYLTGNNIRVSGEKIQYYRQITNLPALYIDLDDGKTQTDIQHGVYSSATYTLVNQYVDQSFYEQPLAVKGRGNYSWTFDQKPYTLKLGEKADLCGMGEAKKWVLVTVQSDKTMMHNYLTQKLAKALELPGTCDNEYVDVIMNGSYIGTYVLTEKIGFHVNRIDSEAEKSVLFEIEMVYRHSCVLCITMYEDKEQPENSVHLEVKEYHGTDVDDMTNAEKNAIRTELKSFFSQMEMTIKNGGSRAALEKFIDFDSFVNWYIVNELCKNYDSMFVTSCYCYINENGKLVMGPCWDYDSPYGIQQPETEGFHVRQAPWFRWLFEYSSDFQDAVRNHWTEIRRNGILDSFYASVDETAVYLSAAEKYEHALYPQSQFMDWLDYKDSVEYFKNWLVKRYWWMDGQFLLPKK